MCKVASVMPHCFDPVVCSPPDSSVHGILQARMMEWLATPSLLGDLSDPGIEPVSPVAPALQEDSLPLNLWGSPLMMYMSLKF